MTAEQSLPYKNYQSQIDATQQAIIDIQKDIDKAKFELGQFKQSYADHMAAEVFHMNGKPARIQQAQQAAAMAKQRLQDIANTEQKIEMLEKSLSNKKDFLLALKTAMQNYVDNYNFNITQGATPQAAAAVAQANTQLPEEKAVEATAQSYRTVWIVVGIIALAVVAYFIIKKLRK